MQLRRRRLYVAACIVAIWLAIPAIAAVAGFSLSELWFVLLFSSVVLTLAALFGWAEYRGLQKLEEESH